MLLSHHMEKSRKFKLELFHIYSMSPFSKNPSEQNKRWNLPHIPTHLNAAQSSVGFGQPVDVAGHYELMVPDLPLQERLQLVHVHLRDDGSRSDEHPQHGVYAFQCHGVQVGEHGLDVDPEQLQRQRPSVLTVRV